MHKYIADFKKYSSLSALALSTVYLLICGATEFGLYKNYYFNHAASKLEAAQLPKLSGRGIP